MNTKSRSTKTRTATSRNNRAAKAHELENPDCESPSIAGSYGSGSLVSDHLWRSGVPCKLPIPEESPAPAQSVLTKFNSPMRWWISTSMNPTGLRRLLRFQDSRTTSARSEGSLSFQRLTSAGPAPLYAAGSLNRHAGGRRRLSTRRRRRLHVLRDVQVPCARTNRHTLLCQRKAIAQISVMAFSNFGRSWGPWWKDWDRVFKICKEFWLESTLHKTFTSWGMLFAWLCFETHGHEDKFWNLWPMPIAQAICLTIFKLSLTQKTCLSTDGHKARTASFHRLGALARVMQC